MNFNEAVVQVELGGLSHVNDGYVDVNFVLEVINQLRETYTKPVEMTQEQKQIILTMKERGSSGFDIVTHIEFYAFNRDDLMHAWLNPNEVIKMVE